MYRLVCVEVIGYIRNKDFGKWLYILKFTMHISKFIITVKILVIFLELR
ncbi:protein of unknown function [Clostridium beijerinckii]|nr:protein of unknown function [Clostridium beijerinckii]